MKPIRLECLIPDAETQRLPVESDARGRAGHNGDFVSVGCLAKLSPLGHSDHLPSPPGGVFEAGGNPLSIPLHEGVFLSIQGSLFNSPRGPFSVCRYHLTARKNTHCHGFHDNSR